jgi:myo-inositol 2-dehydrogenase/D-chiro-inositol 1-dehydrogenase
VVVHVGMIGAGMMGRHFIETIESTAGIEVVAVSSRSAHDDGPAITHPDPIELIRDSNVEAVIVTSPDDTHEAYVLECLGAGKPVLCEKPLAPTSEACRSIIDAETALGRRLVQVGFMRRFDPAHVELKASLDGRAAGEPLLLHFAHRSPGPSRNQTFDAMIANASVHELDAARWLLGDEIVQVWVHAPRSRTSPRSRLGPLLIVLDTASGVVIDIEIFVNARYGYEIRAEAVCADGVIALGTSPLVSLRTEGHDASPIPTSPLKRFSGAYRAQLEAWADTVRNGRAAGPNAWDGYVATVVAEACTASLTAGESVEIRARTAPDLYR